MPRTEHYNRFRSPDKKTIESHSKWSFRSTHPTRLVNTCCMTNNTDTTVDAPRDAAAEIAALIEAIEAGKTLYVCTYTQATKVTAKTLRAWAATGRPFLKARGGDMLMARGKGYDCINFCGLRLVD